MPEYYQSPLRAINEIDSGWFDPDTDIDADHNYGIQSNPTDFFLYTRNKPMVATEIKAQYQSVEHSGFDSSKPTYIIIHGWISSYTSEYIQVIPHAILKAFDCNVILVDWARARTWNYVAAVVAIPGVASNIADMIDFLNDKFSLPFATLTLSGHSLGAHVAGTTGKKVKNGKIHTIVGLDAAKPLFFYDKPDERLAITDAVYVQAIHTNAGELGFVKPIANADFYVNGGSYQPGCQEFGCSHLRSAYYYAEVFELNDFGAIACENSIQAKTKNCGYMFSGVRMGARDAQDEVKGIYYVPVRSSYPYGITEVTNVQE
uniref:Lipase domain-containing protein n=1 Tax=Stomoxys calcitrans TaxID=35570 RepID=A0A1I8QF40_STOCA